MAFTDNTIIAGIPQSVKHSANFRHFAQSAGSVGRVGRQGRQPVGRADSRYAKGTVALTAPINQIYAAVRGFCPVTEIKRIGSIASERRACYANGTSEACKSGQGKSDGTWREER